MVDSVLSGRYELLRIIGQGGMATVYGAHDRLLDRPVAVKILLPPLAADELFVERFMREARLASRLTHPNIVTVFDVGQDGENRYMVQELVQGGTLKDLIRSQGKISPHAAARLARQIALALQEAHGHGIVHRDIKPQNILLTSDGSPKVADFGIARAQTETTHTSTQAIWTSVHYASPEVVQGQPATPASDIYSLGVILYEMATGRLPFEGETPLGIAMLHVQAPPAPISALVPGFPAELEQIIMRALAKAPAERFGSAAELAAALARFESAPAAAPPSREEHTVPLYRPVPPPPPPPVRPAAAAGPPGFPVGLALFVAVAGLLMIGTLVFIRSALGERPPEAREVIPTATPTVTRTPAPTATQPPTATPAPPTPTPAPPTPTPPPPTPTPEPPTAVPVPPTPSSPVSPTAGGGAPPPATPARTPTTAPPARTPTVPPATATPRAPAATATTAPGRQ